MAFEALDSAIPEIPDDDKPDILAYSILRGFVADLAPRQTSPGITLWSELRKLRLGELNYPRWSETYHFDNEEHTVGLFRVNGELPNGETYSHNVLRCSCSLPDHKSYSDLHDEYQQCPAKDHVIQSRVGVYRDLVGGESYGSFDDESIQKATMFILDFVRRNQFSWPPSDRSDRLLLDPLAEVYAIPKERMHAGAYDLAEQKMVKIHGDKHLSISIAA